MIWIFLSWILILSYILHELIAKSSQVGFTYLRSFFELSVNFS